jgi:hypothetical protein
MSNIDLLIIDGEPAFFLVNTLYGNSYSLSLKFKATIVPPTTGAAAGFAS